MKIVKQLKAIIKVCDLIGESSSNPEYLHMLKTECEMALEAIEGAKEDDEFAADTEYYEDFVA